MVGGRWLMIEFTGRKKKEENTQIASFSVIPIIINFNDKLCVPLLPTIQGSSTSQLALCSGMEMENLALI